jgi:hypothetical protein
MLGSVRDHPPSRSSNVQFDNAPKLRESRRNIPTYCVRSPLFLELVAPQQQACCAPTTGVLGTRCWPSRILRRVPALRIGQDVNNRMAPTCHVGRRDAKAHPSVRDGGGQAGSLATSDGMRGRPGRYDLIGKLPVLLSATAVDDHNGGCSTNRSCAYADCNRQSIRPPIEPHHGPPRHS